MRVSELFTAFQLVPLKTYNLELEAYFIASRALWLGVRVCESVVAIEAAV